MKWINSWEKKWFPHDSPYQRIRRRRIIFFSLMGAILLVVGAAKVITQISDLEGRRVQKQKSRVPAVWPGR